MLIKHSMLYVVARLVPGMMGMATTALLTRILDPTSYGLYGLALAVMTFGSAAVFDWLGVSFLRFYERNRGDPRLASTVVQMFLILLAASAVAVAILWLTGVIPPVEMAVIAAGVLMMWAFGWFELIGKFEVANFRPTKFMTMNLGRGLLIIVGAGGAAWLTHSPVWTSFGTAVATVSAAVFLRTPVRFSFGPSHFDWPLAKSLLAFGLPMAAAMSFATLVNSGTRGLIQILDSAKALGIYTACYLVVQNTVSIASAGIAAAAYQLAVRAAESGDPAYARRQLLDNGTLLLAVIAPASLGMALTAHGIASLMVGPQFVDGVAKLTPWMAATGFFYALRAHYFDHAFQLGRRPTLQITVAATSAAVSVGLCMLLIPKYGPVGAAIATTVAMSTGCVHAYIAGKAAFPVPLPYSGTARVAIACAAMSVVVLVIPSHGTIGLFLQAGIGALVYGAVAFALNVVGARVAIIGALRRYSLGARARPSRQGG
ncbi:MAG: lipopolysaccharide biosynthesis protein [Proteobacteria bacterium]|nr:lipopolysaccharide biosynthesis protein [Pseudomonadota bacterium]